MPNSNAEARSKKSTPFLFICKSPPGAIFKRKLKGIIFPKSTKMPFWGFSNLAKKIRLFFLSQNVWILIGRACLFFLNCA
jgi:hypothetical protein